MFFQVETHGHQSQETDGESHIAGIIVDGSLWKQSTSKVCGEGLKKNILCCKKVWDLIVGTLSRHHQTCVFKGGYARACTEAEAAAGRWSG